MNASDLLGCLRPTTLAALVLDCEDAKSAEVVRFSRACESALERLVGIDEARIMIEQEAGSMAFED